MAGEPRGGVLVSLALDPAGVDSLRQPLIRPLGVSLNLVRARRMAILDGGEAIIQEILDGIPADHAASLRKGTG